MTGKKIQPLDQDEELTHRHYIYSLGKTSKEQLSGKIMLPIKILLSSIRYKPDKSSEGSRSNNAQVNRFYPHIHLQMIAYMSPELACSSLAGGLIPSSGTEGLTKNGSHFDQPTEVNLN
ncbi:hypothetical protein OIU79_027515 [Salix purpurea]|uniref:Uncharacterized protein n=1 Tax=Salix purpurea TaxID=77065 RepID=A0A9Q0VUG1_SALPP|nr:hypothetical protein OIU79_027515 [Salix purpurea]